MSKSNVRIVLKHCPRCGKFDLFLGRQKYCDNCKIEMKRNRHRKVKTVGVPQTEANK